MHVEVLGSGTSKGVPEPACLCSVCRSEDPKDKRLRASVFVETHGLKLLIDASPDFRTQALRSRIFDIDVTLLTHQHYDHVGGLDDLRAYGIDKDVPIYALPAVKADLERRLDYCFRPHPYPGVPKLEIHEVGDEPFYFQGLKIVPIHVMHAKLPIIGFRIGNFAYITDAKTVPDSELEKLEGVKVLIVNALRYKPHFSHFNMEEALEFIKKVNPEQAYLTHICHELGKHADVEPTLPENVHLAYDGLKLLIL
ncbi:MAG: MBL fold metallo-hydrolase [Muribaculaceae bacterium]|nr:MBL fold metallo-hydrolase [Muribaculaceae bacterium]